jgi:acyl carrier protein
MAKNEFLHHLEDLMNVSRGELRGPETLSEMSAWDSLAIVSFLAFADKDLGVNMPVSELEKCRTVDDLYETATRLQQQG